MSLGLLLVLARRWPRVAYDSLVHQLDDAGLWLAAVVAGLTALGWLLVRARRAWRRIGRWADAWAARFAAVERLVHHELTPDQAGSVKEQLARIEDRLTEVDGRALLTAGLVAQHVAEASEYVEAVRHTLAAEGIELPDPNRTT